MVDFRETIFSGFRAQIVDFREGQETTWFLEFLMATAKSRLMIVFREILPQSIRSPCCQQKNLENCGDKLRNINRISFINSRYLAVFARSGDSPTLWNI